MSKTATRSDIEILRFVEQKSLLCASGLNEAAKEGDDPRKVEYWKKHAGINLAIADLCRKLLMDPEYPINAFYDCAIKYMSNPEYENADHPIFTFTEFIANLPKEVLQFRLNWQNPSELLLYRVTKKKIYRVNETLYGDENFLLLFDGFDENAITVMEHYLTADEIEIVKSCVWDRTSFVDIGKTMGMTRAAAYATYQNAINKLPLIELVQGRERKEKELAELKKNHPEMVSINDMGFSTRTHNFLQRNRIYTAGDLADRINSKDPSRIRMLTPNILPQCKAALVDLGLCQAEREEVSALHKKAQLYGIASKICSTFDPCTNSSKTPKFISLSSFSTPDVSESDILAILPEEILGLQVDSSDPYVQFLYAIFAENPDNVVFADLPDNFEETVDAALKTMLTEQEATAIHMYLWDKKDFSDIGDALELKGTKAQKTTEATQVYKRALRKFRAPSKLRELFDGVQSTSDTTKIAIQPATD